jgi:hypothetical protein
MPARTSGCCPAGGRETLGHRARGSSARGMSVWAKSFPTKSSGSSMCRASAQAKQSP